MEKTLLILAAGMGSRFGGLKQIEPFGPNGEFLIDYSIYDAINSGFTKVVFVIKKENYDIFKETIGKRVENHIKTEYVFQEMDNIPVKVNGNRIKPWGTAHAILVAKDVIKENFAIINADDFYGKDAYKVASKSLEEIDDKNFALIGYHAINTITENGTVKRGVCEVENNHLIGITESILEKENDHINCKALITSEQYNIENNHLVSMNMLLFTPKIFEYLENDIVDFLNNLNNPLTEEFLIPEVLDKHIKNGDIKVNVLSTTARWYGVTYKEDSQLVKNAINDLIKKQEYPNNLWG